MARVEGGTRFDRLVEKVFYPNFGGGTPGPLAGGAIQAERERGVGKKEALKPGFSEVNILPTPKEALYTMAGTAVLALLTMRLLPRIKVKK